MTSPEDRCRESEDSGPGRSITIVYWSEYNGRWYLESEAGGIFIITKLNPNKFHISCLVYGVFEFDRIAPGLFFKGFDEAKSYCDISATRLGYRVLTSAEQNLL